MSQENVEIVRRVWEAWNAGDLDVITEFFTPETGFFPLRSQLEGVGYRGPEGLREFARDAAEEWEYLRISLDEFRDLDDRVLVLGCFEARGRGSGMDIRFPVGWVVQLRDEKIIELRAYSDPQQALAAAGLLE